MRYCCRFFSFNRSTFYWGVLVSARGKLSSCSLGGSIWLLIKKWERAGLLAVSGLCLKREKVSERSTSAFPY